ncbi:MAG: hypothetical protein R2705_21315 [Ilumatobacteraceae bacterium]
MLIDEIDKAEPDVPNSLLVPLGEMAFDVIDLGIRVSSATATWPIVVLTSNQERDLSPAFERRCVRIELSLPSNGDLRGHRPLTLRRMGGARTGDGRGVGSGSAQG